MSLDKNARRLLRLERDVRAVSTQPRLPYSALDGGSIQVRDQVTGELTGIIGTQHDGTTTVATVGGTWPVAPTMPLVTPIIGGLRIYWDGTYDDGSVTRMDFRRVTFHAVTDVGDIDALDPAQIVGEVTIATGGEVTVALPYVEHFVYAVVWTDSGKFSVESDIAFGTPLRVTPDDVVTDGDAPAAPGGWTADLAPLGVMALNATWPAVDNTDAVTYDIYVSEVDDFSTFDSTTFVGSTAGTFIAIQALPDGTPFEANTDYYAKVIARDADGSSSPSEQGTSQVRLADSDAISPGYVYTGGVEASQILAGDLQASIAVIGEIKTSGAGRSVSISSADGIKAIDPSGDIVAHIPTDSTQDIKLEGDVVARSLTALGPVAMRSADNEVAQAAALVLRSATAAPVSPPTALIDWESVNTGDVFPTWRRGSSYHAGSDRVYQAWTLFGDSGVQAYDPDTGAPIVGDAYDVSSSFGNIDTYSAAREGDVLYVVSRGPGTKWYIRTFDTTTKAFSGIWVIATDDSWIQTDTFPAIAINEAGQLILAYSNPGGTLWLNAYNRDTGALLSSNSTGQSGFDSIRGFVAHQADAGAGTWYWVHGSGNPAMVWAFNGVALDLNKSFPTAQGRALSGLVWDSSAGRFKSMDANNPVWHFYEDGEHNFTGSSTTQNWYVTNTWRDTDAIGGTHETIQGPHTLVAMKRRARLIVTTPPIPGDLDVDEHDDPNAVGIYVGKVDGGRTTQFLQAAPADDVRQATITDAIFSNADTLHPNPPLVGDFPDLTPARIESGDGSYYIDGNGDADFRNIGKFVSYTPSLSGIAGTINHAKWSRIGNQVTVQFRITLTATPSGAAIIGLPVAAAAGFGNSNVSASGNALGNRGGTWKVGTPYLNALTTFAILYDGSTGGVWGPGIPVAWASGDTWGVTITYEAAP